MEVVPARYESIRMAQQNSQSPNNAFPNGYITTSAQNSLGTRYFWKVLANLVTIVSSLIIHATVPRTLGPTLYGNYSFLTNFFSRFVGLCSMGTSIAFYTKLSKRSKEHKLVIFYSYFVLAIAVITSFFLAGSYFSSIEKYLWPDQQWIFICAAALWALWVWISDVINKTTDAYGLTVQSEKARIGQKVFAICMILGLFLLNSLNLTTLFIYHYVILLLLCLLWIKVLKNNEQSLWKTSNLSRNEIAAYGREFYVYSSPLIVYSVVAFLANIFDRWLLQKFAGSVEQGFFGLSYQMGAICFFFTGSMTPLIMREFSIAFSNKNIPLMKNLFRRYIPMLYSLVAFFACFMAVQANKLIHIFAGSHFTDAVLAVSIMSFYPIHQTYGQLSGSVFYATEQTSLYRNIGIVMMLLGIPVTYFLIAPKMAWGINAGATGLAIKMVALQFLTVNVQLYFNSRLLKFSFFWYLRHQILSIGCLFILAYGASLSADHILGLHSDMIIRLFLAGIFYSLLVIGLAYYFPTVFGMKRKDIQSFIEICANKLRLS